MEQPSSFLSYIAWKQRLVFWIGAIIVGLVIVVMTGLLNQKNGLSQSQPGALVVSGL
ncbi:MAG: hypothetical protein PHF31_14975 [Methylobacter sp.]|nr:hypothetical protein [Methylobacter sp.]